VVLTRGAEGALAYHAGEVQTQPAFEAETVDPVGTGDAFVGAFMARRVAGEDVATALRDAAAAAALKRTIRGDVATVTPAEVEAVVAGEGRDISR
jgi:2-dehydro-3-deoxygluconokinase